MLGISLGPSEQKNPALQFLTHIVEGVNSHPGMADLPVLQGRATDISALMSKAKTRNECSMPAQPFGEQKDAQSYFAGVPELRQLCDPREKSVALLFSGTSFAPKQVSSALQNTQKTTRQTVLTQAYKEKTGTEQGTKVEAAEKEAVGSKARAEPGSAGTHQTSSASLRGLRDSSSSHFKALGGGGVHISRSFQPSRMTQCATGLLG